MNDALVDDDDGDGDDCHSMIRYRDVDAIDDEDCCYD